MVRRPAESYTPPTKAVATLLDRITATLREYLDQGGTRTDLVRAAGNDVAQLRSLFTRNGAPDWSGRSRDYQFAMSEIYERLDVKGKRREALGSAVRFHAGNVIREKAETGELDAAGLDSVSPRDRIQRRRDTNAVIAGAVGLQAGASESLPKVMAWVATLLEYAESLTSEPLEDVEREAVRALIADTAASVKRLKTELKLR